jgi:hypothetical protein
MDGGGGGGGGGGGEGVDESVKWKIIYDFQI